MRASQLDLVGASLYTLVHYGLRSVFLDLRISCDIAYCVLLDTEEDCGLSSVLRIAYCVFEGRLWVRFRIAYCVLRIRGTARRCGCVLRIAYSVLGDSP